MKILQLTTHFSPNVGGLETHLLDLVNALAKKNHLIFVLTYRPLADRASWKLFEKAKNTEILRLPWIPGFFYKFVSSPILEFLYLVPGLFLVLPFTLLEKRSDVIHAHGLISGFIGVFWAKVFDTRIVISTHYFYKFPKSGFYKDFARWIFSNSDKVICLSDQSRKEIISLGVPEKRVTRFVYWIDLNLFSPIQKSKAKQKVGWKNKFVVLFVGRLVREKGIKELLESVVNWNKNITLAIVGSGPFKEDVEKIAKKVSNVLYLGTLDQKDLPFYYSAADLLIVPSTYAEGFGRVIIESLACGTPVLAAKRGAIVEAMDESVGKFINVTSKEIKETVEDFHKNPKKLKELSKNSRKFAEERYSPDNVDDIILNYMAS